jgi:hypothetical protein
MSKAHLKKHAKLKKEMETQEKESKPGAKKKVSILEKLRSPINFKSNSSSSSEPGDYDVIHRENYSLEKYDIIDKLLCEEIKYKDLDERWKSDYDVAMAGIARHPTDIQYATENVKTNESAVLLATSKEGYCLKFLPPKFQDNMSVVKTAISNNPFSLNFASDRLKNNFGLVSECVKINGKAIQYASEELRKNKEIGILACQQNGYSIIELDESIQLDEDVLLAAVKQNGKSLQYIEEEKLNNLFIFWEAITQNPGAYRHVPPRYLHDMIAFSKIYRVLNPKDVFLQKLANINFKFE